MGRNKNHRVIRGNEREKTIQSDNSTTKNSKKWSFRFPFIPIYLVEFLLIAVFAGIIYSDVFFMAEQTIYFAFDRTIMYYVLTMPDGWINWIGRFVLLSFKYPLFGGIVLAGILTGISILLDYLARLKSYLRIISACLPMFYLGYIVWLGLNFFFDNDPSYLIGYPTIIFVSLVFISIIVRLMSKHRFGNPLKLGHKDKSLPRMICLVVLLAAFVGITYYSTNYRENTRATARMQRLMLDEDWDKMIDIGRSIEKPCREVACYYAIALSQTGQIGSHLFDIAYDFPNLHLKDRNGAEDHSTELFEADGDFFAGLINSAYHACIERSVIDGPSVFRMKRMYLCALLNGERNMAYRFLNLISQMPFEQDFVERYGVLLYDREKEKTDNLLSSVREVIPAMDTFEQWYKPPVFIGYNVGLTKGRSRRALDHSLAACLYSKQIDCFMECTQALRGQNIPQSFMEELVIMGMKNHKLFEVFEIPESEINRASNFLNNVLQYKGEDRHKVFELLKDQYLGYYPFYYYFENLNKDEEVAHLSKTSSSH